MKRLTVKLVVLVGLMFGLGGCTTSTYDMYTGVVKHGISSGKSKLVKFYTSNNSATFEKGDILEIRLQNLIINQLFETFKNSKQKNELGIFITVYEKPINDFTKGSLQKAKEKADKTKADRRLVYKSAPRKPFVPLNQSNTLIYRTKYQGGDLYLKVEVVEFDTNTIKNYGEIINTIIETSKTLNLEAPSTYTKAIDKLSKNILKYTKDDLILSYETELLKAYSTSSVNKQQFLREGDIVFVRDSQNARNFNINQIVKYNYNRKTLQFTDDKDDIRSYLVLSILKREI